VSLIPNEDRFQRTHLSTKKNADANLVKTFLENTFRGQGDFLRNTRQNSY